MEREERRLFWQWLLSFQVPGWCGVGGEKGRKNAEGPLKKARVEQTGNQQVLSLTCTGRQVVWCVAETCRQSAEIGTSQKRAGRRMLAAAAHHRTVSTAFGARSPAQS